MSKELIITLLTIAVSVGIAYQTLASTNDEQSSHIDRLILHQEVIAKEVNTIKVDIGSLVTSQEFIREDNRSIIKILQDLLAEAKKE